MANAYNQTAKPMVSREAVIIKLTLLIGACRQPRITKRQIEESLERYIRELEINDEH